jgi:pimeloyl-ACP methyl ester carboxylesterase
MGGEENLRRASHESYRSRSSFTLDSPVIVRKSVDRIRSLGHTGRFSPRRENSNASSFRKKAGESESSIEHIVQDGKESIKAIPGIVDNLQVAYLLVSPLQGWVNTLATMWSTKAAREKYSISEHEMKFTVDPTLAIFGDDDVFVSVKKLRNWVGKLSTARKGKEICQFRHKEVPGAGHFWHDYKAVQALRTEVKDFVSTL